MISSRNLVKLCGKLYSVVPQSSKSHAKSLSRISRTKSDQSRNFRGRINEKMRMDKPSAEFTPEGSAKSYKNRPLSDLWKPAAFTVGFSASCFIGASIWQQERLKRKSDFFYNRKNWGFTTEKRGEIRNKINSWWSKLTDGQKALVVLIALNGGVFALWRFAPRLQTFMLKHFTNGFYAEKLCSPLLLSVFSHYSAVHLGLNMFVLYSFGSQVIDTFLGMEQFTALYLSAGVLASMVGVTHKALIRSPVAALGASGAILGILMYSCLKMPDARLSIIFFPFFTFSAASAVYGIIAFDAAGLILGWRMFDHAAHLGGGLFGVWYAKQGEKLYAKHKHTIAGKWKELTERKKPPPPDSPFR